MEQRMVLLYFFLFKADEIYPPTYKRRLKPAIGGVFYILFLYEK